MMKISSTLLFCLLLMCEVSSAQDKSLNQLVAKVLENERSAHNLPDHFAYTSREVSNRTGHHVWIEHVVDVESGEYRRLVSIDGRPLSTQEQQTQDRRLAKAVAHADFARKQRENQKARAEWDATMKRMPQAFRFFKIGMQNGCTKLRFEPDPQFSPQNYRERFYHVLEGTVSIKEPEDRFCAIEGQSSEPIEVIFGLLGKVQKGGHFRIVRTRLPDGSWHSTLMQVHLNGRAMLVADISQDVEVVLTDVHELPEHLSAADAALLTKP
ncbi:MAG TPA: hypothetical protein VGM27_14925 [Acidobacteriaceae bacterium]|jgi:hypothetical protein